MLCRKKMILLLTLTCLSLLCISANHFLTSSSNDQEQLSDSTHQDQHQGSSQQSYTHQKLQQPDLAVQDFVQHEHSVEFRTLKPSAVPKNIGNKYQKKRKRITMNFISIFSCRRINSSCDNRRRVSIHSPPSSRPF